MNRYPEFTSRLSKWETVAALLYIPIHIVLLPSLLQSMVNMGYMQAVWANVVAYGLGFLYMLAFCHRFLRRDYDPLCDGFLHCLAEVGVAYGLMYLCNLVVSVVLSPVGNPNNAGIMDLAGMDWNKTFAMSVFLAPVLEEVMFRAAIFGKLRNYNRRAAYLVSVLLFSVYHVWGYAVADPRYWAYVIQYFPVAYLLCRVYERTNSIWSSILFHALVNSISLNALKALEGIV